MLKAPKFLKQIFILIVFTIKKEKWPNDHFLSYYFFTNFFVTVLVVVLIWKKYRPSLK